MDNYTQRLQQRTEAARAEGIDSRKPEAQREGGPKVETGKSSGKNILSFVGAARRGRKG